jgi:hypothetical protein
METVRADSISVRFYLEDILEDSHTVAAVTGMLGRNTAETKWRRRQMFRVGYCHIWMYGAPAC